MKFPGIVKNICQCKTDVKQKIKKLLAVSYEHKSKYFSFTIGCYSIKLKWHSNLDDIHISFMSVWGTASAISNLRHLKNIYLAKKQKKSFYFGFVDLETGWLR